MKLLVCIDCYEQLSEFIFNNQVNIVDNINLVSFNYKDHEIKILKTGFYKPEVYACLLPLLASEKFHLAIKISYGMNFNEGTSNDSFVNIVNEKDLESRIWDASGAKSFYEAGLLDYNKHPHVRGGFINMNNSYMNVFLPYKKVVGISPSDFNNPSTIKEYMESNKSAVATLNGFAFSYSCLFFKQNYYHLANISNNINFATKQNFSDVSKQFYEIIDKL